MNTQSLGPDVGQIRAFRPFLIHWANKQQRRQEVLTWFVSVATIMKKPANFVWSLLVLGSNLDKQHKNVLIIEVCPKYIYLVVCLCFVLQKTLFILGIRVVPCFTTVHGGRTTHGNEETTGDECSRPCEITWTLSISVQVCVQVEVFPGPEPGVVCSTCRPGDCGCVWPGVIDGAGLKLTNSHRLMCCVQQNHRTDFFSCPAGGRQPSGAAIKRSWHHLEIKI